MAAARQHYCEVEPRLGAGEVRARESEAASVRNEQSNVSSLPRARVSDRRHVGILSRASDAPLAEVAGSMAEHQIDADSTTDHEGAWPVGVVSALGVVAAAVCHPVGVPSTLDIAAAGTGVAGWVAR